MCRSNTGTQAAKWRLPWNEKSGGARVLRPSFLERRLVSASDKPHVLTVRSRSRALRPAGYYLPDSATERLTEYGGHRPAKPHSDQR